MPFSAREDKPLISILLTRLNRQFGFGRILDVGAGSGTYSRLLRAQLPAEWTALEIWEPYRERFELDTHYDRVLIADARSWAIDQDYDLVLCGDVLEHMTQAEANELVVRLLDHTQLLLISIPIVPMPQQESEGNPFEKHVKDDWTHRDVLASFPNISMAVVGEKIGIYLLSSNQGVHEVVQLLLTDLAVEDL